MCGKYEDTREYARSLDNNDLLGHFRQRFFVKKGEIYMCGNSLGLPSRDAEESLFKVIDKWREGIKIWNTEGGKYLLYSAYLSKLMGPLIGADADEIAITGGTTINIHQTISTFYHPTADKYKILVDDINFPTDRYAVESQVRLHGYEPKEAVKVVKSRGNFIEEADIIEAMTEDVAVIFLPAVYYKTAQVLDMHKLTAAAKERDIIIGWDLCHGVGAIEINLKEIDADFAVWCTYKYLNGGPGSAAGLYINRKHFKRYPGLAGWFGNKAETQFLLNDEFEHNENAQGWQIGTPNLFSMATLEGALRIINEAGIKNIRKKSLHLTGYLMYLVDKKLEQYGFSIGNLREASKRGGHVCLKHVEGYKICLALKCQGVVPDFRYPDVIRLAPTALYTSYEEVYNLVEILTDIMKTGVYKNLGHQRDLVF